MQLWRSDPLITVLSFADTQAQGGQPQPTPGLEDVASIALSSNKGSVCAGGVGSPVHQATLVATAKNKDGRVLSGKSISFTVQNADASGASDEVGSLSASNPTSGSPLTVTTNANGDATVTFTSSRVIGASNIIKAASNGKEATTSISMADESGTPTISKANMIADGEDSAELKLTLTSEGGAVDGHSISWRISKVTYKDENDNIVNVDSADFPSYGGITPISPVTNASGISTAKFTTGTNGGSITFEATDNSVTQKGQTGGLGSQSAAGSSAAGTPQPKSFVLAAYAAPTGVICVVCRANDIGNHAYLRVAMRGSGGWYGFYPATPPGTSQQEVPGQIRSTAPDGNWGGDASPGGEWRWVFYKKPISEINESLKNIRESIAITPKYSLGGYNCTDWVNDMLPQSMQQALSKPSKPTSLVRGLMSGANQSND